MSSPASIHVLNGPNLNLLGKREPQLYGSTTLDDITMALNERAQAMGLEVIVKQSNHEGQLVDWVHEAGEQKAAAIIMNAGAYSHSSIALRDAIPAVGLPVVEVHLTNIYAREHFRRQSLISHVAVGGVQGFGAQGYLLALDAAARIVHAAQSTKTPAGVHNQQGISDAQKQRH
ncbi:type II 3-dehydroquinate dehydratase [Sphingomicrobium aestuariivivum]|uniref:type II 3-dehydroquinate dehydratase n=1 Tax=Sphingomicrobium aestuariivivum TaxID=1582356 RepID=UPI00289E4996|nr:type II 3-dehydroquinate dehydratase [Sphingomicrobium aestuariivivum]